MKKKTIAACCLAATMSLFASAHDVIDFCGGWTFKKAPSTTETMQAAGSLQNIGPRTQVQIIGIAQNDLCARLVRQVAVKHALDAAYGTHGHENGRFDRPVVGRNQSGAGRAGGIGMNEI